MFSHHRLIAFAGSGSGAGKSVLSSFLHVAITARGIPAHLISEEEGFRLEALQPFMTAWKDGDPDALDAYLTGIQSLVDEWSSDDAIRIVDTIIPGFLYHLGCHPLGQVRAYGAELATILFPMDPVIIYLAVDVGVGWQRAVEQRGTAWRDEIVAFFTHWHVPYTHYPPGPVRDEAELLAYFTWLDQGCRDLLALWPGETLVLDATNEPLSVIERRLLDDFHLADSA